MYNTTTIPTVIVNNGPTVFHALLSGFIIVMPFFAGIFHLVRRYDEEHRRDGEEDSDEEEKEGGEEKEGQYVEEFNALTDRELTEKDFKELETKMVKETIDTNDDTKKVDIIMSYHKDSESFWYYTNDLKEIAYKTLESVARKFVIEHNCKRLYMQAAPQEEEKQVQCLDKEGACPQEGGLGACPRSVFAKFKKYNTGTKGGLPNYSNDEKTSVEQTNHFRYKGKLYHYEETLKEKERNKDNLPTTLLDYAAYKLMMQTNKKEN